MSWVEDSHGQLKPVQQVAVAPTDFQLYSGQELQLTACLALMILGFAFVWWVHARWGDDRPG